jgi:hypothetical protein
MDLQVAIPPKVESIVRHDAAQGLCILLETGLPSLWAADRIVSGVAYSWGCSLKTGNSAAMIFVIARWWRLGTIEENRCDGILYMTNNT